MFKQGFVPLYGFWNLRQISTGEGEFRYFEILKKGKKKEENPNIPLSFQGLVFLQASLN